MWNQSVPWWFILFILDIYCFCNVRLFDILLFKSFRFIILKSTAKNTSRSLLCYGVVMVSTVIEYPFVTLEVALHSPLFPNISLNNPDSNIHGANIGPIWGRQDPGGPHVGLMNLAILVKNETTAWQFAISYKLSYFVESLYLFKQAYRISPWSLGMDV